MCLFYPIIRIKLKNIKISYRLRNLNRFEYFQILSYYTKIFDENNGNWKRLWKDYTFW